MRYLIVTLLLIMMLLSACSVAKYNQTSVMKPDYGTLRLVGESKGREVSLDGVVIALDPKKTVNIFELKTGTYALEIRSEDRILMAQKLFITNNQTNEVKMP